AGDGERRDSVRRQHELAGHGAGAVRDDGGFLQRQLDHGCDDGGAHQPGLRGQRLVGDGGGEQQDRERWGADRSHRGDGCGGGDRWRGGDRGRGGDGGGGGDRRRGGGGGGRRRRGGGGRRRPRGGRRRRDPRRRRL